MPQADAFSTEDTVWAGLATEPDKLVPLPGGGSMPFRRIPAGEFWMGSRGLCATEEPRHRVVIPEDYWLGKYLVTRHDWLAVVHEGIRPIRSPPLSNKSIRTLSFIRRWTLTRGPFGEIDVPSTTKKEGRWDHLKPCRLDTSLGCRVFFKRWQSFLDSELASPIDKGWHLSLPLEAEWEYACRAGSDISCDGDLVQQREWVKDHPAGLIDMFDLQWCADMWLPYRYRQSPDGWEAVRTFGDKCRGRRDGVIRGIRPTYRRGKRTCEFLGPYGGAGFRVCLVPNTRRPQADGPATNVQFTGVTLPAPPSVRLD